MSQQMMRRRMSLLAPAVLMAAGAIFTPQVQADPFVYVSLQGRVDGTSNAFSSVVAVNPGDIIDYQAVVSMAPAGTNNSRNGYTITSLVPFVDGISALKFNIFELGTDE